MSQNKIPWSIRKKFGDPYRYDFDRVSVAYQSLRGYWAVRLDKKIVSKHGNAEKALRRGREVLADPKSFEAKAARP